MPRPFPLSAMILLGFGCVRAAVVSGIATDRAGRGLDSVLVRSVGTGLSAYSDPAGAWRIEGSSHLVPRPEAGDGRSFWTGSRIRIDLSRPSEVDIDAIDAHGRVDEVVRGLHLDAGRHELAIDLPGTGVRWIRIKAGSRTDVVGMVANGRGGSSHGTSSRAPRMAALGAAADTLVVSWKGKRMGSVPLPGRDTSGVVVRFDTTRAAKWNDTVAYGSLYDARDGQLYRTIAVGTRSWMAENLDFAVDSSWWHSGKDCFLNSDCASFGDSAEGGARYGRFYQWPAAIGKSPSCLDGLCLAADSCRTSSCPAEPGPLVQGICPEGWRIPNMTDWKTLDSFALKDPRVYANYTGTLLKSTHGWDKTSSNGEDVFGFRLLPSGYRTGPANFELTGAQGYFWTSKENLAGAYTVRFYYSYVEERLVSRSYGVPVRCLKER